MLVARQHLGLWLVLSCWAVVNTGVSSMEDTDSLYQRAQYQMRELEKTLRELETRSHIVKKRSTDVTKHCVDLVRLVQKMCHNENPGTTTTTNNVRPKPTQNTNTITISEKDKILGDLEFYRNATLPEIIVYKAKAKRNKYKGSVEVELEFIHSSKIYVVYMQPFNFQEKFMDSTHNLGKRFGDVQQYLSRVSLTFDTSVCWNEDGFGGRDQANLMILPNDNFLSNVHAEVDICKYDQVLDEHGYLKNRTENDQVVRSQNFKTPKFKILSDPGETKFIERGENPSFDVEMVLEPNNDFVFSYYLYDWQLDTYENNWVSVRLSESNELGLAIHNSSRYEFEDSENLLLLQVDVLDVTIHKDSSDIDVPEKEKIKQVDAKVRVTVDIGSRELSGPFQIGHTWREEDWGKRDIIRSVNARRTIKLRFPYKIDDLPPNSAEIYAESTQCGNDGDDSGKHCIIECQAWGRNIKSIFIIKSHFRFPVKSYSYVTKNVQAFAGQDVGPASKDVDGNYRCTVVLENGKTKSKDMFLATTGFTKVKNFTMEDLGNSTSRLVCTAYGYPPLDISFDVFDDGWNSESLNNTSEALISDNFEDLTTTVTILISNDKVQYPIQELQCRASGERGDDYLGIRPEDFLNVYNPFIPKLNKENSTVVKAEQSDTTTTIYCLATSGGKPVDMMVVYGGQSRSYRIDKDSGNVRSQQETDDGSTLLTLTVPTRSIQRYTSWLYCGAENEFGDDWIDFYLPRYGIDD